MQFHEFLEIHLLRAFLREILGNNDDWGINIVAFSRLRVHFLTHFFNINVQLVSNRKFDTELR